MDTFWSFVLQFLSTFSLSVKCTFWVFSPNPQIFQVPHCFLDKFRPGMSWIFGQILRHLGFYPEKRTFINNFKTKVYRSFVLQFLRVDFRTSFKFSFQFFCLFPLKLWVTLTTTRTFHNPNHVFTVQKQFNQQLQTTFTFLKTFVLHYWTFILQILWRHFQSPI